MNFSDFITGVMLTGKQVIILYVLVAVGFITDKTGLFTDKTALKCTDLLFYIITPAKILESFLTLEYSAEMAKKLFVAMGFGAVLHIVAVSLCSAAFNKCPKEKAAIYKYATAYGNCGYMSLPLVSAIVGDEGVFYCSAVIITFQIFSFTHGIWVMNIGKGDGEKAGFDPKKIVLNPGVIAVIIGLPLYIAGVNLPEMAIKPVQYVASLNTPLAMIMFGTYMAHAGFRTIFSNFRIPAVAALKLVVLPGIMLAVYRLCGLSGALLTTLVITASAPSANNTVMFAAKYGRDTGLASQVVSAVSLISIVTIPLMTGLAQAI